MNWFFVIATLIIIWFVIFRVFAKRPTIDDYKKALMEAGIKNIPETYKRSPVSELEEGNKFKFLRVAFELLGLFGEDRDRKFRKMIDTLEERIDEYILMDSDEVINEVGTRNAIVENRKLIFQLSENLDPILEKAKEILLKKGFSKGIVFRNPRYIFVRMFNH